MPYKPDYDLIRFEDKDDKLNRKESAMLITDYLLSQTDSKVIAINSAWGTGKTWFVHMWKNELRKNPDYQEKVIPIYYNAWENDDYEDAFIPLLAAINEYLPEDGNKKEVYLNAAKELFVSMISGPLKKMTFDMVDGKEIKEIYDKYKESLGSDFELAISDFQKQKELKENFSNALKEFTLVDKEEHKDDEEKTKKIFIFIDELDRCRPTFAIETLERIKHYFGIENVHFILSQDSEQLSHSVEVLYGTKCDTKGYLRRFIDFSYEMPTIGWNLYIVKKIPKLKLRKEIIRITPFIPINLRQFDKIILWFEMFEVVCGDIFIEFNIPEIKMIFIYWVIVYIKNPLKFREFVNEDKTFIVGIRQNDLEFNDNLSKILLDNVLTNNDKIKLLSLFIKINNNSITSQTNYNLVSYIKRDIVFNFVKNIPKFILILEEKKALI